MASSAASALNFTTGHNRTTKLRNPEFFSPVPNACFEMLGTSVPYIVNAALNIPLAIATTFANLLVLLAMRHVTSIRLPSKLLLCSLVLTDLGAGLVAQPQFIVFLLMSGTHSYNIHRCFLFSSCVFTGSLFSSVSLLTLTAISLDRYTALFLHLKYQEIVTTWRVCAVLTFIWSFSLLYSSAFFWKSVLYATITITGPAICFPVISAAYIKIYQHFRTRHGQQVQPRAHTNQTEQQVGNTLTMAKHRRTAATMMWVYVCYVVCFSPYICTASFITLTRYTVFTVCILQYCYLVLLLNSCLNPLFYCLRLPEIRAEVMKQLRQFRCPVFGNDETPRES